MNRETWLNNLANLMAPRFVELGHPVPPFRVAVGFTSAGKSKKIGGECWHSSKSADKRFEILISPILDDSMMVAGTLAHELTHAAAGFKHNHRGDFAKVVLALGLQRPLTATIPGPEFIKWAQPFIDELGPIPHARLSWDETRSAAPAEEGEGEGEEEGGSSNAKKKQSTRLLKASCEHADCGYTVRLSKKWAAKLGACCPQHGPMEIEGLEEDAEEEQAEEA